MACANRPQPAPANTPDVSPDERISALAEQLREARGAFEVYKSVTDIRLQAMADRRAERKRSEDELREQITELRVRNAVLEVQAERHEKATGRGWQLWLAALGFGFGLISLLVTAALQLKK